VFARLEPAVGDDTTAGVAGNPTSREISIADSKGSGAGKNAVKFRLDAASGLFFCEPLVVADEYVVAWAPAFGELFGFVTGSYAIGWLEGAVEGSDAPSAAAKLPEFPAAEFRAAGLAPLKNAEAGLVAGVTL
jgi:hypothetical protein